MGDPPRQRDEGVLRGAVIYIQSRGRDLREVFDEVRFIQVSIPSLSCLSSLHSSETFLHSTTKHRRRVSLSFIGH